MHQLTSPTTETLARLSRSRLPVLLLSLSTLACFALAPITKATPDPSTVTGATNTADGASALGSVTTGTENAAFGYQALFTNSSGYANIAVGSKTLYANDLGCCSVAVGNNALTSSTTASANVAIGSPALYYNKIGAGNVAVGYVALFSSLGNNNIGLGSHAGQNLTTSSDNIDIGNAGKAGESGKIRIGTQGTQNGTFIAGIAGTGVSGAQVLVNSSGKLGVATSSARFKHEIKPMEKASEAILALKPVTFHYKEDVDPDATPQFGLVAEQVEKVSPDLVIHDEEGKPFTVRYDAVNAMLLNEFLKDHRRVEEQGVTITQLKSNMAQQQEEFQATSAAQQKQIETLTAGLQKVGARVAQARELRTAAAQP